MCLKPACSALGCGGVAGPHAAAFFFSIAPFKHHLVAIARHGKAVKKAVAEQDLVHSARHDYGVYGVPETYIIDKAGIIRLKHIGPVTPDVYSSKILPLVAELNK